MRYPDIRTTKIQGSSMVLVRENRCRELPEDQYWGEVAIHFTKGAALVLSISQGERKRLFRQLQCDDDFFHIVSLSNRIVAVRRAAVTDLFLSDQDSDTYGPEHESYEQDLVLEPRPAAFWAIVDDLILETCPIEEVESKYGKDVVAEVREDIAMSVREDIDALIEKGKVNATDRESVLAEAEQCFQTMRDLATNVVWQLSSGQTRQMSSLALDLKRYSSRYMWIYDMSDPAVTMIVVGTEDGQTAFLNPKELDYGGCQRSCRLNS